MLEIMARKPITANDVADWFINRVDRNGGDIITPEVVQRLVYFAQAWYLANTGRPMFKDEIQAWATGPMVPSIFERFEHLAAASLPDIENAREIRGDRAELLEQVQEEYGSYSRRKLGELAREEGSPWHQMRQGLAPEAHSERVIEKDGMKKFYGAKISKAWA